MSLSIALVWGLGERERGRYSEKREECDLHIEANVSVHSPGSGFG